MDSREGAAAERYDHWSRDRARVAVFRQISIDTGAKRFHHGLHSGRKPGCFGTCIAQIAKKRVFPVFGLGVPGGVGGSSGRAGKDVRSAVIIPKDFDGFRAESANARDQTSNQSQEENAHREDFSGCRRRWRFSAHAGIFDPVK
jgi:hypothetical protein